MVRPVVGVVDYVLNKQSLTTCKKIEVCWQRKTNDRILKRNKSNAECVDSRMF